MSSSIDGQNLVTLTYFNTPYEASIAQKFLEDQGIYVYVAGSQFSSLMPSMGVAAKVHLLVREVDLEQAQKLLKEIEADFGPNDESI